MKINYKILLLFAALLFSVYACRRKSVKHISHNKRLISVQSKLTYAADNLDTLDSNIYKGIISNSLNKKTDTIKYSKGEIYISSLRSTSGCSQYTGDIEFSKDTIKLLVINTSDTVCSERNVWRVIYKIANKGNKNYLIKKD